MKHTAFFGDAAYTFALTDTMIHELQIKTGVGIGALYLRMTSSQFHVADIIEIIRLALIGGGTAPTNAQRLINTYAVDRPFEETFPLALDILDVRWNGKPEVAPEDVEPAIWTNAQHDLRHAATTGDMSAAINESLQEIGL
ncbi:tail tube GTA-gp10-like protein [Rhizobium sp. PP-F2F-G48]|uniref:gene transfer agent family protein n=1 Tax=Rhizobium sp. PP-F2F-G48 TaxID=2135651 RepID=UPI00104EB12E|nr:gene transfer agent family protein [Rhizobium sp. PP-F2F-G48]TCM57835.1 tail tube GTA-gp10-like protein [Rhizobium sp. PP-F2F-G48]